MSGYRPGIPQQPYTKWDTDKDEVEVDYKRLDAKHSSWFSGRKGFVLKVITTLQEGKPRRYTENNRICPSLLTLKKASR